MGTYCHCADPSQEERRVGPQPRNGKLLPFEPHRTESTKKRVIKNRRAIDLPRLMADPHLRMDFRNAVAAKLASPILGTNAGIVDDMTSLLTKTLPSNAPHLAPPIRRKTSTEGLVCDRGDESGVDRRMAA